MDEGWDVGSAFGGLRARLDKLEALEEAQNRLASEPEPDGILKVLAECAVQIINAETLAVTVLSGDSCKLRYEYAYGKHAGVLRGMELPIESAGLCGWVLANRKPILSVNLLEDPRIVKETAVALGIHTALLTPLIAKGKIIGGLSAFNKQDGSKFDEDDLSVLSQLSSYAAFAVVNTRLMRDLEREKIKAEVVLNSIGDGLLFITCDGVIHEANRALRDLGLTRAADLTGSDVKDLDPAEPLKAAIEWDAGAAPGEHCWEVLACVDKDCPVHGSDALRCWTLSEGHFCMPGRDAAVQDKIMEECANCEVMKTASARLAEPREVTVDGRTLRVTGTVVIENVGDMIAGELIVFHDITAEKELERHRDEFISMLSHDLKVPISSLIGYSEMIGEEDDLGKVRELNSVVKKNSSRLLRMINNLLDYSRAESGRMEMELTPVVLGPFICMALEPFAPAARDKGVTLGLEVREGIRDAYADLDMLTRILGNLVQNALEHAAEGGSIRVNAANGPDGFVEISVKDDGPGIGPENQRMIFDKYYSAGKGGIGGSGLGLFIVKALAEIMGGRVGVESAPGSGATFRVLIPAAPRQGAPTGA